MKHVKAAVVVVALGMISPLAAQEVTFRGQIRPRTEFRDPAAEGAQSFTSMRVRVTMAALLEDDVSIVIQLQDVRIFGEETSTLGDFSADNLDLHQGFVDMGRFESAATAVRIGRQEVKLGGERLVGSVGWTQQARSFDGARVRFNRDWGSVDFIGFKTAENLAEKVGTDAEFVGVYATVSSMESGALDLYGFYQRVREQADVDQATLGARFAGSGGRIDYRAEASLQVGDRGGDDVRAFMLGGRVGFGMGPANKGRITLWYDYLSGDDTPGDGKARVFDTMFATNHKFYGFADLFLNIPVQTAGLGLQDFAVKGSLQARNDVKLGLDLHSFRLAKRGGTTTAHLAEEIDFTVTHRHSSNLGITGGLSVVIQADGFADIGRLTENATWGYLMLNATF
ncbi:MAG: alginate export family protein [Longimicrobiales bacterium]